MAEKRKKGVNLTPIEREEMITEVSRLERMCYPYREIGQILGISPQTVVRYVEIVKERYGKEQVANRQELVARKLAEYRDLRLEAWRAYERSKQDAERESEEWGLRSLKEGQEGTQDGDDGNAPSDGGGKSRKGNASKARNRGKDNGDNPKGVVGRPSGGNLREFIKVKSVKMRQGRLPGIEYLRLIADTYKAEREMLGLDEAIKLDVKAQVLDWKVFTLDLGHTSVVEHKMQEALNQLPPQELLDVDAMKNGGWEK